MQNVQALTDKAAIGLSLICVAHCLVFPLVLVLLPSVIASFLGDEIFHFWMLACVVPLSVFALTLGCRKHKYYRLVAVGALGIFSLLLAVFIGDETWEQVLTVSGASMIAIGHYSNYKLCRRLDSRACL